MLGIAYRIFLEVYRSLLYSRQLFAGCEIAEKNISQKGKQEYVTRKNKLYI